MAITATQRRRRETMATRSPRFLVGTLTRQAVRLAGVMALAAVLAAGNGIGCAASATAPSEGDRGSADSGSRPDRNGSAASRADVVNRMNAAESDLDRQLAAQQAADDDADGAGQAEPMPEWTRAVPYSPGDAFFGVGVDSCRSLSEVDTAEQHARIASRVQIAETLKGTVATAVRPYLDELRRDDATNEELEAILAEVANDVVGTVAREMATINSHQAWDARTQLWVVYVMSRLPFDTTAAALRRVLANKLSTTDRVITMPNLADRIAEDDELDRRLRAAHHGEPVTGPGYTDRVPPAGRQH